MSAATCWVTRKVLLDGAAAALRGTNMQESVHPLFRSPHGSLKILPDVIHPAESPEQHSLIESGPLLDLLLAGMLQTEGQEPPAPLRPRSGGRPLLSPAAVAHSRERSETSPAARCMARRSLRACAALASTRSQHQRVGRVLTVIRNDPSDAHERVLLSFLLSRDHADVPPLRCSRPSDLGLHDRNDLPAMALGAAATLRAQTFPVAARGAPHAATRSSVCMPPTCCRQRTFTTREG